MIVGEAGGIAQRILDRRNAAHRVGVAVGDVAQRIAYFG